MKLSIVCVGYRPENWKKLYDSIPESFSGSWELICIGPYAPDFKEKNFTFIEDWGQPARCCQLGLLAAKGDWVSFAWDDGWYLPEQLDVVWATLK